MTRTEQFLHGTKGGPDIGGAVLPGRKVGRNNWPGYRTVGRQPSSNYVFTTKDEKTAWRFADADWSAGMGNISPARSRVLVVEPSADMKPGSHNPEHRWHRKDRHQNLEEYVSSSAKVTGAIDIMPGRQGTFPHLNWNQFAARPRGMNDEFNHPDAMQEETGHPGGKMFRASLDRVYGRRDEPKNPSEDSRQGRLW